MKTIQIKTHKMKNSYEGNYFFLLSKGLNAGQPLDKPCPNCFVIFAKDEAEKSYLYWLCYGLWQGRYFHTFLTGSVIPFIRFYDLKRVIQEAIQKADSNPLEFQKSIDVLNHLNKHQQNIHQQLCLIKEAKKALMYKIMK